MKLSELSTDQALDVMCEMTPYINNIASDTELMDEMRRKVDPEELKTTAEVFLIGAQKLNVIIPVVLKKHRPDVYGILSILNEKTIEEIARQNFITTGIQIREVIKDKAFFDFFKSLLPQKKNARQEGSTEPAAQE